MLDVSCSVLSIDGDTTSLTKHEARLSQVIFDTRLQIRWLLQAPAPAVHIEVIKLLKINVPTFVKDIVNQRSFWERYEVCILSRKQLLNPEKLAYIWHLLKKGPAQVVVEELSGSGDECAKAIP